MRLRPRRRRDRLPDFSCSFCGKHRSKAKACIAGPGVYICDECIRICNEILHDRGIALHPT